MKFRYNQRVAARLPRNMKTHKPAFAIFVVICLSITLSCRLVSGGEPLTPGSGRTAFSGRAFVDSNGNQALDEIDKPLANALFLVAGYGGYTDATGSVEVALPGRWEQAVTAQMLPPAGSDYTLIGPSQVVLQAGAQTSADFLFAAAGSQGPAPTPKPGSSQSNLTYCTAPDGTQLKMDVQYPAEMRGPAPVVVYVHGGGWVQGDKTEGTGTLFLPMLQRKGYITVSINYRLAPAYRFPAQIEDVKCAIRHLRANATRYNLDPERIGALGGSAGGHLVALLGLADASAGWDEGAYADQSSRVQAVVDLFGPSDLTQFAGIARRGVGKEIFGAGGPNDPLLRVFSPVTYITPDDPPFLILHGDKDSEVPPEQSQMLYDQLKAAGVPAELVWVKNAGHAFQASGGKIEPNLIKLTQMVAAFFNQYLK